MDSLARKHNRFQVRKTLTAMPDKINVVLDEAMHRIPDQVDEDSQLVKKKVLSWIS